MLLSFFYISSFHLHLSTLSPFSWEVASHKAKPYNQWPFHISRISSHRLRIMESPLLPEPSRSVFLGILRKTLGVDPGMTPCPVPGLWGTSQLGIKPVLAVSRILVALRLAILTGWRRQRYRTVKESYTTTRRETGDKWGVASLNMQPFFFLYVRFKIFSVKKLQQSANPIDFTQTMLAGWPRAFNIS